ncbi:hypothetical protein [Lentzea indica]|uniref:hypothetical protein n=1 Tax=Lentzea indica TaxID=2604800 RepID=UPI00165F18F1
MDDFALRRHDYGTLLIDIEARRPVDVLTDLWAVRARERHAAWIGSGSDPAAVTTTPCRQRGWRVVRSLSPLRALPRTPEYR